MPRAPRQDAAEPSRDRPVAPPAPVDAALTARRLAMPGPERHAATPAALMWLQSTAGNQAVTRGLAARSALQREPAPEGGARPGADLGADAGNVTVTFVLRDFNLPKSGDASTIDFLHEPGVSIQVAPKQAPEPVVQAAISALNIHLGRHGKDLVEIAVGPQASAGGDKPSVGAQAQAQIHVTSTFSFTASTSVAAAPPGGEPDPGSLRQSKPGASVDITWSPVSLGVVYKLDGKEPPRERGQGSDFYATLTPGKDVIAWVAGQLDRSEFTPPGGEALDVNKFVTDMFDAMLAAKGDEAQFNADLGVLQERDWPPGLARGLARAGQLLVSARSDFAHLRLVRLAILNLPPDGKGPSRVVRWKQLPLQGEAVTPAPASGPSGSAAAPSSPPIRTWGTGPPVTPDGAQAATGPTALGQSRVVPAPPPMRGVPVQGDGGGAPRTWGGGS
jgi:hypothetical protein